MDTTTLTAATITDEQIRNLCYRACEHGDMDMVRVCLRAIDGNYTARKECAKVLNEADPLAELGEGDVLTTKDGYAYRIAAPPLQKRGRLEVVLKRAEYDEDDV